METAALKLTLLKPKLGIQVAAIGGNTVKVIRSKPRGPASGIGIRTNDHVSRLDYQDVQSVADFQRIMQALKPGEKTTLTVRRNDEDVVLVMTVGSQITREQYRHLKRIADGHFTPGDEELIKKINPGKDNTYAWDEK